MCISKRQKSDIIINIIRQPKPISWFETISLIKKYIFLFRYLLLRKINGLDSSTFPLEQKSGFKLERNKDLAFIVWIIDIDWYEKNIVIMFWAILLSPTST